MGTLFVVATPIGNLGDITSRALEVLKQVDLIACEDTRQTMKLLNHFGIQKPLTSYHDFNEEKKAEELVRKPISDTNVALVSDAGTPGISDPGYRIVRICRQRGIDVVAIPGPNAAVTALSVSGLPSDEFLFMWVSAEQPKMHEDKSSKQLRMSRAHLFFTNRRTVLKKFCRTCRMCLVSGKSASAARSLKFTRNTCLESYSEIEKHMKPPRGICRDDRCEHDFARDPLTRDEVLKTLDEPYTNFTIYSFKRKTRTTEVPVFFHRSVSSRLDGSENPGGRETVWGETLLRNSISPVSDPSKKLFTKVLTASSRT